MAGGLVKLHHAMLQVDVQERVMVWVGRPLEKPWLGAIHRVCVEGCGPIVTVTRVGRI
jgi:hypothetical protein